MSNFRLRTVLMPIGAFVLLAAALAFLLATAGTYNIAADSPHTALVRHMLGFVRARSIAVRASSIVVPRLDDNRMIADGGADYDAMCTSCHLAPGMAENEMRPGMNPKPPLLASGGFGKPAQTFWVIKHGIKMTGMPAWGMTHSDVEIWNMVAFLQVLPRLSAARYHAIVASAGDHHEHRENPRNDHMDMSH